MTDITLSKATEIAEMFGQSISWVCRHYKQLGGEKIGGRVFFPAKEVIYERLFSQEQGMALRLHPEGREVHSGMVPDQERGNRRRAEKKTGVKEADLNRHGLFETGE